MESGTRILQPDSDSPARWEPRVLSSPAAGRGDAIPPVPAIWLSPDPPGELHAARRYSVLSVARIPAPGSRTWSSDPRRASRRSTVVTSPILRDPGNSGFVVELEKFSGPLDLLLHLIREDEVDITDLPIAKIADQFLSVIAELGLNQAADARAERFGRGYEAPPPDAPPAPLQIDLNDLLAAAERVIALFPEPMLHRVVPRPLDVEGATERIMTLLSERETFGWRDAVGGGGGPQASLVDVLSTFIALLELAKRSSLTLSQPEPFGPMVITRAIPREAA